MDLVIYGAQGLALGACRAIKNLYPQRNIQCFLVTFKEDNTDCLDHLPVVELNTYVKNMSDEQKDRTEILIATPENVMLEIEKSLDLCGLYHHVRLDSRRWSTLMAYHYSAEKHFTPLSSLPVGYHRAELSVYMAKFYKDKELSGDYQIPEWITPIQVGAALCDSRVARVLDNQGDDHISEKNVNYSELTGLYWLWKNGLISMDHVDKESSNNKYYGLVHYRRMLTLSEDDLLRLVDNDVDVVLPYPMPYEPNIEAHHQRYLKDVDWKALIRALTELEPEYAARLSEVMNQQYLCNYNIIVARKDVLREYCEWLFPILKRVEEISEPQGSMRSDRYIGYMGETLETIYFMLNRDRYNVTYAGCNFMI